MMEKYFGALLIVLMASLANAESIESVLAYPDRLPQDLERDARSRPDAVIPLLQLEEGDRVADIFGGGGYYSELLAGVVGESGEVLLQNNQAYRNFVGDQLKTRFENRAFKQITRLNSEAGDLKLGSASLDAALIIMSYHDLFYDDAENGWPKIDDVDFIGQIHRALKSDGRFLLVDHAAADGSGADAAQLLHRIDEAFVVDRLKGQGFKLVESSDVLRNGDDDHTLRVFDPPIRGRTDRFVLVFEKM
jgi:predicted methyltransferase